MQGKSLSPSMLAEASCPKRKVRVGWLPKACALCMSPATRLWTVLDGGASYEALPNHRPFPAKSGSTRRFHSHEKTHSVSTCLKVVDTRRCGRRCRFEITFHARWLYQRALVGFPVSPCPNSTVGR